MKKERRVVKNRSFAAQAKMRLRRFKPAARAAEGHKQATEREAA